MLLFATVLTVGVGLLVRVIGVVDGGEGRTEEVFELVGLAFACFEVGAEDDGGGGRASFGVGCWY